MTSSLFLDTAFAIALSSPKDDYHQQAVRLAEELETKRTRLITTRAVIVEIGNALAKPRYRATAVRLLDSLEGDPRVEIVPLDDNLFARALQLYRQRHDKKWGLTDCISFIVMSDRGITEALTTDEDFQQAGFRVLLG